MRVGLPLERQTHLVRGFLHAVQEGPLIEPTRCPTVITREIRAHFVGHSISPELERHLNCALELGTDTHTFSYDTYCPADITIGR